MTRVLLLAYHFPPIGGGGTQRSLKFARYLPGLGYDVTVVTGRGGPAGRWTPSDESLLAELPPTEIRRIGRDEPAADARWPSRLERWFGVRSEWTRWWVDGAVEAGEAAGAVDVVLASMSPFATAEAAARLARRLGRPWVADLRDPWAFDEMTIYPTVLHRRRELARMRRLLRTAAAVVANTPEAAARIRTLLGESSPPVATIPNGFDGADFAGDPPERRDDAFRVVHTGSLHTELGGEQRRARLRRLLGGEVRGVDILTRSHVHLLEAVDRLLARRPELRSRLEVVLAGATTAGDEEAARRYPFVRLVGYQPHEATVALMRSADLLFLPMQNLPPGSRATIVPGKTYEYLAAGRPILAAVPEGDARGLLLRAGTAHVCAPDDVEGMAAAIEAQVAGTSRLRARPPADLLARFERRALAAELAALLDSVTGRRSSAAAVAAATRGSRAAALPAAGR